MSAMRQATLSSVSTRPSSKICSMTPIQSALMTLRVTENNSRASQHRGPKGAARAVEQSSDAPVADLDLDRAGQQLVADVTLDLCARERVHQLALNVDGLDDT